MKGLAAILLFIFVSPIEVNAQAGAGGGQTKENVSAFTTDTVKLYFEAIAAKDAQILALHKELSEARDNHARDLREAADKRYEQRFQAQESATVKATANQNEFRGSLNDLSTTKLGSSEYKVAHEAVKQQITDFSKAVDARLVEVQRRLDLKEGSQEGSATTWFNIFAVIAAVCAVLGVLYLGATRSRLTPANKTRA